MEIKTVEELVLEVLKTNIRAKEDDFILYGAVLKRLDYNLKELTLYDFLANAKKNQAPIFESVSRARRKIAKKHPELVDKKTDIKRRNKEEEYKEWNRL